MRHTPTTTRARACPHCHTPLRHIRGLDHQGGAAPRVGFAYVLEGEPKMGQWKAEVKNRDGDVHAVLCECGHRVLWYAEPV